MGVNERHGPLSMPAHSSSDGGGSPGVTSARMVSTRTGEGWGGCGLTASPTPVTPRALSPESVRLAMVTAHADDRGSSSVQQWEVTVGP